MFSTATKAEDCFQFEPIKFSILTYRPLSRIRVCPACNEGKKVIWNQIPPGHGEADYNVLLRKIFD